MGSHTNLCPESCWFTEPSLLLSDGARTRPPPTGCRESWISASGLPNEKANSSAPLKREEMSSSKGFRGGDLQRSIACQPCSTWALNRLTLGTDLAVQDNVVSTLESCCLFVHLLLWLLCPREMIWIDMRRKTIIENHRKSTSAAVEAVTAVAQLAVAQGLAGLRPMIPLLATAVTVRVKMLFHVVSCCFMLFHVVSPLGTLKSQFRVLW